MKSLWFKQCYVQPILTGQKSDTYRIKKPRFVVGELIAAQVGPVRPFATLQVDSIRELTPDDLSEAKRIELEAIYDLSDVERLYHISFSIQQTPTK